MAETRSTETQDIHKTYADFYRISGGLTFVILGIWIGSLLFADGYATNVYTELLSVIATILVLDQINQWRDKENLKKRLLSEAQSSTQGIAVPALKWLREENWLEPDSFKNKEFKHVNWSSTYIGDLNLYSVNVKHGRFVNVTNETIDNNQVICNPVNFDAANLIYTNFKTSNLQQSSFRHAALNHANFEGTQLQQSCLHNISAIKANFKKTNLTEVDIAYSYLTQSDFSLSVATKADFTRSIAVSVNFSGCDLSHADFSQAELEGASLSAANLFKANLTNTNFYSTETSTILPDGEKWTAETDMEKFTNPQHPNFAKTLEKINAIRADMNIDPLA